MTMENEDGKAKFCPFGTGSGGFVRCAGKSCCAYDEAAQECLYVLAARTIVRAGSGTPLGFPPLGGGGQAGAGDARP